MGKNKPCTWNDIQYGSIKEAAKAAKCDPRTMAWRIAQGFTNDYDVKVFSNEDVLDIRKRHTEGDTVGLLSDDYAKKLGYKRSGFDRQIEQILMGITYRRVGGQIVSKDELNRTYPVYSTELIIEIRKQYQDGTPVYQLAEKHELSQAQIRYVLKKPHVEADKIISPVDSILTVRNPNKMRISSDDRQYIYEYYQNNQRQNGVRKQNRPDDYITMQEMADIYGVDISYISRIAKGER